jgi:hypothetical protein
MTYILSKNPLLETSMNKQLIGFVLTTFFSFSAFGAAYVHDRRQTVEELAHSTGESEHVLKNRFAATGVLLCTGGKLLCGDGKTICNTSEGTAEIAIGSQTIVTAAHIMEDPDTCLVEEQASHCTFTIETPTGTQSIKVDHLIEKGLDCPRSSGARNDWAVLKLSRPVTGVKPYRVDDTRTHTLRQGASVFLVCHSIDFIRKDARGKDYNPKHLASCAIKHPYPSWGRTTLASTDCDLDHACSGGSVLSGNEEDPALIGIPTQFDEPWDETKKAVEEHKVDTKEYYEAMTLSTRPNWASYITPVNGKFLNAIRKANGLPPFPLEDDTWGATTTAPSGLDQISRTPSLKGWE